MPVPVQESGSILSVYINVCVGFESVRAKIGVREAPYTGSEIGIWGRGLGGSG